MSNSHSDNLHEVHKILVGLRREAVRTLLRTNPGGATVFKREDLDHLLLIQNCVNAVGDAFEEETANEPSVYETRGLREV